MTIWYDVSDHWLLVTDIILMTWSNIQLQCISRGFSILKTEHHENPMTWKLMLVLFNLQNWRQGVILYDDNLKIWGRVLCYMMTIWYDVSDHWLLVADIILMTWSNIQLEYISRGFSISKTSGNRTPWKHHDLETKLVLCNLKIWGQGVMLYDDNLIWCQRPLTVGRWHHIDDIIKHSTWIYF